jgi:hypothetical protein
MHYGKCNACGKEFTKESYEKETVDIADGWTWEVIHKKEYCKKEFKLKGGDIMYTFEQEHLGAVLEISEMLFGEE